MDEQQWLTSNDPQAMLDWLTSQPGDSAPRHDTRRPNVSDRRLRLFAVACCRSVWHLLTDPRSRNAVEVAERFAEGEAIGAKLKNADEAAWAAYSSTLGAAVPEHRAAAFLAGYVADAIDPETGLDRNDSREFSAGQYAQFANILRDIISNPFRPIAINPAWRTPTTLALAETAYRERAVLTCKRCEGFGAEGCADCSGQGTIPTGHLDPYRLGVLSDALEEVGADEGLLRHLREPGPHYRGCAAVDCILDKRQQEFPSWLTKFVWPADPASPSSSPPPARSS